MPSSRYRNPTVRPGWYKSRQRTITPAQKRAERAFWPLYGLAFAHQQPLDLDAAFGRTTALRVLELGCGCGEAVTELAQSRPEHDFLAIDWMRRGLATCLMELDNRSLSNVRLVRADAATLLADALPPLPTFDEVLVFFPDPWNGSPERRLIRPDVISSLSAVMRPNGCVRVATDVAGYPEHIRATLASARGWEAIPCGTLEAERTGHCRPSTLYEREAIAAGREIEDLCFVYDEPLDGQDPSTPALDADWLSASSNGVVTD